MNIFESLYKEILLKYKNKQLGEIYNSINNERIELNDQLFNLIHEDRHIINKYYNVQKGGQKGGQIGGLTEEEIKKMQELKGILDKINQINPDEIKKHVEEIKSKTEQISQTIGDFPSKLDVKDLFDKIPQKLNVIQTKLGTDSTNNQLEIASKLRSLYVPFDNTELEASEIPNSKKLNEILDKYNKTYEEINKLIDSQKEEDIKTLTENIETLKNGENGIIKYMENLNNVQEKLKTVNKELEIKNKNFAELSRFNFERKDLVFIIDGPTLKNKLDAYNSPDVNDNKIIEDIKKEYEKKNKLYIDFILYYNEKVNKLTTLIYGQNERGENMKLPRKLYTGSDTKAISNNMIKSDIQTQPDIMISVGDLLKIKLDKEFDGTPMKAKKLEEMYNPSFSGGGLEQIEEIKKLMSNLEQRSKEYMKEYKSYVKNTQIYNRYVIYEITHSTYLLSILSNALFVKGSYQVYKYIGRGMINFYKRIIEKIYKDLHRNIDSFTSNEEELKNLTQEIRKKYFLTISILRGFLERLSQLLSPTDIIDIDECDPKILQYFTLLNHFKNILEKYNETQMNKLTIFSRVNDIKMNGDFKDGIMQTLDLPSYVLNNSNPSGSEIYNKFKNDQSYQNRLDYNINNKLFLSDYLRRNIYAGYYIKNNTYEDKVNLFDLNKNKLLKFELREFKKDLNSELNITNTKIKDAYNNIIKIFFNENLSDELKIEELEKYKKETLSVLLKEISDDVFTREKDIIVLTNRINSLKTYIIDIKSTMEDTYDSLTINRDSKPIIIENIRSKEENIKKETELATLENEKNLKKPEEIESIKKDLYSIKLVIRIALEYLYATSPLINEKLMWLRNITCDAQKSLPCEKPQDNPYDNLKSDANKPTNCTLPKNIPYLNSYKFTEVFDTQNFVNNSDMAAYMCLNTRLSGGNGVCLITYGYSGTGKSYTLFGALGKDGLLQGTLSKLDGLEKVYFRTFEIYGKGLPYVDYWYDSDETKQKNKQIYNYLYAYKLTAIDPNTFVEGIKVEKPNTHSKYNNPEQEWAVELEGQQIGDYINKINVLRDNIENKKNDTTSYTKNDNNGKEDILDYMEISNTQYQQLFRNFSKFTDKIEEMRIQTQRVRETPNNKVSSRSILIYDFVVVINKDDKTIPVNLLIIDLPGREEIAPTFINKYADSNTNPILYNIIKEEFKKDYEGKDIDSDYKNLFNNNPEDTYMKELKAMLCAFTLNPLCVPLFACEIIEKYIKNNYITGKNLKIDIIDKEIDRKYKLYGELNGVFVGNEVNIDAKFKLLDEFYYLNYSEKLFVDNPKYYKTVEKLESSQKDIQYEEKNLHNYFIISDIFFKSKLGWYTFHNLLQFKDDGSIKLNENYDNKPLKAVLDWNNKFKDMINLSIPNIRTAVKSKAELAKPETTYKIPYGNESLTQQNGRQIKILLFINFIKRIIDLNRYDILNDLFQTIIDAKINKYIKKYIDRSTELECQQLITNLIENNFKRDALKEKFKTEENFIPINNDMINTVKNILGDFTTSDNKKTQFKEKETIEVNFKEYLYESIKYDFYTTGFEGIYINENIIGLIKYLGKDGKDVFDPVTNTTKSLYLIQNETDRNMIDIIKQKETNTFNKNIQLSKLINVSKMENEGKQNALSIDKNAFNISAYGQHIIEILKPTNRGGQNALVAELAKRQGAKNENRAKVGEAMNLPEFTRYDEKTKLKLFKLNSDEYINQLFIKSASEPLKKEQLEKEPIKKQSKASTSQGTADVIPVMTLPDYGNYFYNPDALDEFFNKTIKSYESNKIFCYDNPIIKTILNPYLDVIGDFKIFYLFGNYEKPMRELKCAQQYELLETTNNFIEAITR